MDNTPEYIIGIDLGTTYSCVGIFRHLGVEIIKDNQGSKTLPSYVSFTEDEKIIGLGAKNIAHENPENTIYDIKRLIGRKFQSPEVQKELKYLTYQVESGINDNPTVVVKYQGQIVKFTPEEISGMILSHLKEIAETYLGMPVKKAIITVPAYFNDAQRQATKDAGQIAGLEVIKIINEPTSGAIAYGLDHLEEKSEKKILVIDWGGGTLDISLLDIEHGMLEVKATSGNTRLGGEDLDNNLLRHCAKEIDKIYHLDITNNLKVVRKLRTECEKAKCILSSQIITEIFVENLLTIKENNEEKKKDFKLSISRAKLEELCKSELGKCFIPIEQVLSDANINKNAIDDVILIGGSTKIPKFREMVQQYFSRAKIYHNLNPDEAVAMGASIYANVLRDSMFGLKSDMTKDIILLDVTPLSLGVETYDGLFIKMIERNTTIPFKYVKQFSTVIDNQRIVQIKIYEGERELANQNNLLGTFELTDLPLAPKNILKLDVCFEIDTNGILFASCEEKSTGKNVKIAVNNDKGRLTTQEINRMISNASQLKENDLKMKESILSKNELITYINGVKSSIENKEIEEKLGEQNKKSIHNKLTLTLQWLEKHPKEEKTIYDQRKRDLFDFCQPLIINSFVIK